MTKYNYNVAYKSRKSTRKGYAIVTLFFMLYSPVKTANSNIAGQS